MEALKKYMRKAKKGDPFDGDKGSSKVEGLPEGVKKADQYAKTSGRKVVDDETSSAETTGGGKKGAVGPKVVGKKGKKRPYMD